MAKNKLMGKKFSDMSQIEKEKAWNDIGEPIHQDILKGAREGSGPQVISLAAVQLTRVDGSTRIAYEVNEYGDHEGLDTAHDFLRAARKLLQPGERLDLVLLEFTPEMVRVKPTPEE